MDIIEQASYQYWAEKQFFNLLEQCSEDQWLKNIPGFTRSLQEIYIHKYEVMYSWFTLLYVKNSSKLNENPLQISEFDELNKEQFIKEALLLFDKLLVYVKETKEEKIKLELEWIPKVYDVTNYDIIFNILNHLSYHRGQTAFLFKNINPELEIPETDFNPYMYEKLGLV